MPKSPQDYWKEIEGSFPAHFAEIGLDNPVRMAFYMGIVSTLDFVHSLQEVEDKEAAFRTFVNQLDAQRYVEQQRREAEKRGHS